jgi:hypothetical protein
VLLLLLLLLHGVQHGPAAAAMQVPHANWHSLSDAPSTSNTSNGFAER